MVNDHLNEEQLQEYALDRDRCENGIKEHVQACAACKEKAADYQMLFAGIRRQPAPVFEFDIREAVLSQITPRRPKPYSEGLLVFLLILAGLLFTGFLIYVNYRHLSVLMEGLSPFIIYLMLTTGMAFLSALVIDACRIYKKNANLLDFK